MAYWFRHGDPAYPPLWEGDAQPAGRWHAAGDGPVQYLSDTPTGAWAEFLRHEAITDPDDLADVTRILWAVDVPDPIVDDAVRARRRLRLGSEVTGGGRSSYPACRRAAARLRDGGVGGFVVTAAALRRGAAAGWRVVDGLEPGAPADGQVLVLFGARPELECWWTGGAVPVDPTLSERVVPLTDG